MSTESKIPPSLIKFTAEEIAACYHSHRIIGQQIKQSNPPALLLFILNILKQAPAET